jgi:hypothetical protein
MGLVAGKKHVNRRAPWLIILPIGLIAIAATLAAAQVAPAQQAQAQPAQAQPAPTHPAQPQVKLSLPMAGYYRTGRYMPIRVSSGPTRKLELRQEGVLPIDVVGPGLSVDAVVPALVVSPPSSMVHVRTDDGAHDLTISLRALGDSERLVGFIGTHHEFQQWLFPGKDIIPIPLDPARPLPGAAAAWELLDAIVVDGAWPASLDSLTMNTLLGAGTVLAVRSATVPDAVWPWTKAGDYWVLRHVPVGPTEVSLESAYAPVSGWAPGVPARTRRMALALAGLFSIAAVAVTLLPGKKVILILLAGVAAALVAIDSRLARLPPVRERRGAIVTAAGPLLQRDLWMYQTSLRPYRAAVTWRGSLRPILNSAAQIKALRLKLECAADATPARFSMDLDPQTVVAFLLRTVVPGAPPAIASPPRRSPLQSVAEDFYIGPGVSLRGAEPAPAPDPRKPQWMLEWPAVVLQSRR